MADAFSGFPAATFRFYEQLAGNNTKPWWTAHKGEYESLVREPMTALMAGLESEFGPAKLFRPYNDQRFAKGEPYKTQQGAVVMIEDAIGYYAQVSAEGLRVGGGWYAPGGRQLARVRAAIDGPKGSTLERLVTKAGRRFEMDTNPLATRPRGVDPDHPRIELLRARRIVGTRLYEPDEVGTAKTLSMVRADWRALRELLDWIADHAGPIEDPDEPAVTRR
jgi:uncharacterized protein (TIGR02453 family)